MNPDLILNLSKTCLWHVKDGLLARKVEVNRLSLICSHSHRFTSYLDEVGFTFYVQFIKQRWFIFKVCPYRVSAANTKSGGSSTAGRMWTTNLIKVYSSSKIIPHIVHMTYFDYTLPILQNKNVKNVFSKFWRIGKV